MPDWLSSAIILVSTAINGWQAHKVRQAKAAKKREEDIAERTARELAIISASANEAWRVASARARAEWETEQRATVKKPK